MLESERLTQRLREAEEKRKKGEISTSEFYRILLDILADLKDVLINENINETQIKRQIPLLLAFIKSQIGELEMRGH